MGSNYLLLFEDDLDWEYLDEFPGNQAAPLDASRQAVPGPGITLVTDSLAGSPIVNGFWEMRGTNSPGDPGVAYFMSDPAAVGKASYWNTYMHAASAAEECGFASSQVTRFLVNSQGTDVIRDGTTQVLVYALTTPCVAKYLTITRSDGSKFFVTNGILRWIGGSSTSRIYMGVSQWAANDNLDLDTIGRINLVVNGYGKWARDFTELTDSLSTPASGTILTHEANAKLETSFTYETGKYIIEYLNYTSGGNTITVQITASGSLVIETVISGSHITLLNAAGVFTDGVGYTVTVLLESDKLRACVNGVDKLVDGDISGVATTGNGSIVHNLATNDIYFNSKPYPTLGTAVTHLVCPQANDVFDAPSDTLIKCVNTQVPPGTREILIRGTDSGASCLGLSRDTTNVYLKQYPAGTTLISGTYTPGNTVTLWLYGVNARLYDGASVIGTSAVAGSIGQTGGKVTGDWSGGYPTEVNVWAVDQRPNLPSRVY